MARGSRTSSSTYKPSDSDGDHPAPAPCPSLSPCTHGDVPHVPACPHPLFTHWMSVLCHPSVQPNHAAVDTSADPAQRRRVHALSLFRLWRDVLTDQLDALCLRTHSSNHTLCGIPLTTLLHLAITHNIKLPATLGETATWAVPSTCHRSRPVRSRQAVGRPTDPCPSGRCKSCDALRRCV